MIRNPSKWRLFMKTWFCSSYCLLNLQQGGENKWHYWLLFYLKKGNENPIPKRKPDLVVQARNLSYSGGYLLQLLWNIYFPSFVVCVHMLMYLYVNTRVFRVNFHCSASFPSPSGAGHAQVKQSGTPKSHCSGPASLCLGLCTSSSLYVVSFLSMETTAVLRTALQVASEVS